MFKKMSCLIMTFCCCAIGVCPLLADNEDHVEVGSGGVSQERVASLKERLVLAALENEQPDFKNTKEERLQIAKSARGSEDSESKDSLSLFSYASSHAGAFHAIVDSPSSYSFSLEDGSVWNTSAYIEPVVEYDTWGNSYFYYLVTDGLRTSIWYLSDNIVIEPNHWSTFYDYWLTNKATGVSIPVSMELGPFYSSPYRYSIVWIDYNYGYVHLNDGTRWMMDSTWDIKDWRISHTVIIGGKDSWFFSSSPNTLINVDMLNYAAGKASYY